MLDRSPAVGLLSLDAWDDVWRRNQHLAAELARFGAVRSLLFVTPPDSGLAMRARRRSPIDRITVVTPPLVVPRRYGGHVIIGRWLHRALHDVDVLWVNDPVAGAAAVRPGVRVVYDITDDWRSMPQDAASRARTVRAEDLLAERADATVVCSPVLAGRWRERYGIDPVLVPNGVDVDAVRAARTRELPGCAPHAVYVGTVHANRVDLALVERVAASGELTVHLVGPTELASAARDRLTAVGVLLHGPVPATDVPGWLVSADVLICPHLVDEFTLSLDAIKAHEYLATDRPVVATPSSGFQELTAPGLTVTAPGEFVAAAAAAVGSGRFVRQAPADWRDRASEFSAALLGRYGAAA